MRADSVAKGKAFCTVLDFVGTHRKEFRFDRRFQALLGGTRRDVERAVQQRFPFLPAGCHLQLDEKASEIVLQSLRNAIPSRWPAKVDELRRLHRVTPDPTLGAYLHEPMGGGEAALKFLTGYLLEEALSVDNLFVMALVFTQFRVPKKYQHPI